MHVKPVMGSLGQKPWAGTRHGAIWPWDDSREAAGTLIERSMLKSIVKLQTPLSKLLNETRLSRDHPYPRATSKLRLRGFHDSCTIPAGPFQVVQGPKVVDGRKPVVLDGFLLGIILCLGFRTTSF